jgi:hypothetical protein
VRCLSSSLMAASSPSSSTTWRQHARQQRKQQERQARRHLTHLLDNASADTCAQCTCWEIAVHNVMLTLW